MKHKFFLQLGLIVLTSITFTSFAFAAKGEPLDRIVAIVGDGVITQSELNQTMSSVTQQMQSGQMPLPATAVLRKQVLDQLINKKMQLQLAEQSGITVTDEDLNKAIKMIADNNHVSTSELYQKISEQGTSAADYRKEIREELTIQHVQQQAVGAKISITPQEVDDFMHSKSWQASNAKEYHLEDILIALPEAPTPDQVASSRTRAEEVLTKLRHGMNFNQLAAAESGNQNALQGGDLGWRKIPEIPSAFVQELAHMKPNDLSKPIQTPNGFHIIKLTDIRNAVKTSDAIPERKQVEQLIYQRKMEESLQSWMTKLRSETFINMHPEG